MQTTAVRRGDEYVLNGSKTFITNAGYADWTVVFAKTDPAKGHRGMSAFIVPMDAPGVTIEQHLDKMGQRATDTSAFALRTSWSRPRTGSATEGEGFKIAMQTLDFTRPGTAVGAVGRRAGRDEHGGRLRQGARHLRRADRDAPGRQLHDRRHGDRDRGRAPARRGRPRGCSTSGERATLYSSFAKRFAADTAMKVTTDAVQVFGGYGYIKEYPVEKLMRDAKLFQIYEGTSQIQRLVIAKEIFIPR